MCSICDENNGEMAGCQDCGRLICFDVESSDDVVARAYVTASGDLFCARCGRAYDEAEEEEFEEDYYELPDETYMEFDEEADHGKTEE